MLLLLPLLYLVMAKSMRPALTWPGLLVGLGLVVAARALGAPPSTALVAIALVVLVWGAVGGRLRHGDTFQLQAWGMLAFGGLALAGLAAHPDLGRYLVAAGWLLHGVWDFVHLYHKQVVAPSFAEWCGVVDVLVAVELLFLR